MAQKLGWLLVIVALATPAAASAPGSISGTVRNTAGVPQMGAEVEVFASSALPVLTVFTDGKGFYSAAGIGAGTYHVKVSAPSFLPALREDVSLRSGANLVVNVTLNTLFEALQLMPARRPTGQDDEDWKWTLRSTANRPVLRVLEDGPLTVVSKGEKVTDRALKARVAFLAGSDSDGFNGGSDMRTAFSLEQSMFTAGTFSLGGNVGYNGGVPGAAVRAAYSHQFADGSKPVLAVTARRFGTPETVAHNAALQALALSLSDSVTLANFLDLDFGTEYQTIQFMGRVAAVKPFGSVDVHLSPNTVVEYRYATSQPNTRAEKGFDSAPADLTESGPRVSMSNFAPMLERARHHELSMSQRVGKNNFQVALYADRIANPALTGVGEVGDTGDFLPDVYSGTFTYRARNLDTNGVRLVYQRKLTDELTATVDYSYGGVVELDKPGVELDAADPSMFGTVRRSALTCKVGGTVPGWKTNWSASYKWTSGGQALTPVDMFNVSPGQADAYLNIFVRQPIPGPGFMPARMEALVDVRNLLAQGYVPVFGQDGHTLYLVQSARAIRGGVAFTF
jgi:hypothetical protein